MTFEDYMAEIHRDVISFGLWWTAMADLNPGAFPAEMPAGEWDEQFRTWLSLEDRETVFVVEDGAASDCLPGNAPDTERGSDVGSGSVTESDQGARGVTGGVAWNAADFARRAHGDQMYGDRPYSEHLQDVVDVLRQHGIRDDVFIDVGYLHDILEDTAVEYNDLVLHFSDVVAGAVLFCTDLDGVNRKARKAATYGFAKDAIARANTTGHQRPATLIGCIVKLADRIANLQSCRNTGNAGLLKMYQRESFTFRTAYSGLDLTCSKRYAKYAVSLAALWNTYDALVVDEQK